MAIINVDRFQFNINPDSDKVQGLREGDIVIRRYFQNSTQFDSTFLVESTGSSNSEGDFWIGKLLHGDEPAATGDELYEFVRVTNLFDLNRMGAIEMSASDNDAPFIRVTDRLGMESASIWADKVSTSDNVNGEIYIRGGDGTYGSYEYFEDNRRIRVTKNSTVAPFVYSFKYIIYFTSNSGLLNLGDRYIVSYRYRSSGNNTIITQISDATSQNGSMQLNQNFTTDWQYFNEVVSIDHLTTDTQFHTFLGGLNDGEWVEYADFSIIPLDSVINRSNDIKATVGKLDGVSDEVFGNVDGYGVYSQKLYATGDVNISGTFSAGDASGFGASVYAGKIRKNVVLNSTSHNWGSSATVDNSINNPLRVGNVWRFLDTSNIGSNHRFTWNTPTYRQSIIGETVTFSFWAMSTDGTKSVQLDENDKNQMNFSIGESWNRYSYTFIVSDNLAPTHCFIDFTGQQINENTYICGMQLEVGEVATLYQPTDGTLSSSDDYGLWANRGGFGGTIQNPLIKLNPDGGIVLGDNQLELNADGTARYRGAVTFEGSGGQDIDVQEAINQARDQAISTAATDATSKANSAQSAAAADATSKANTAQQNAAADATSKANSAQQNAINAATNLANAAQQNAQDYFDDVNGVSRGGILQSQAFRLNSISVNSNNDGEIETFDGSFIHPNGNKYSFLASQIYTPLESSATGEMFIAFIGSDTSRFSSPVGPIGNFVPIKFINGSWNYNNNSNYVPFTINTNDCIVASIYKRLTTSSGIEGIDYYCQVGGTTSSDLQTGLDGITSGLGQLAALDVITNGQISDDTIQLSKLGNTIIEGGLIKTDILNATAIQSEIINTSYIQGLNLSFTRGTIGGWSIANNRLESGNIIIQSGQGIVSGNSWRLNNDGSGLLANNNISWDASGNVRFSPRVRLEWVDRNLIKIPWNERSAGQASTMTYGEGIFQGYPSSGNVNNLVTRNIEQFDSGTTRNNIYTWVTEGTGINGWNGGLRVNYTFQADQSYMFACWVKNTSSQSTGSGAGIYFGMSSLTNISSGNVNNNPYFAINGITSNRGEWLLYVGVVHSRGTDGNVDDISGIYNINGDKVGNSVASYRFSDGSGTHTSNYFRLGMYRTANGYTFFQSPQLYVMDGSQPSINDLIGKIVNTTHIDSDGIYTGTLTADQVNAVAINANSITTGTISANRINTSEITSLGAITAGSFNLGGGNFAVDTNGNMTSLSGAIGGWTIANNRLFSGSVQLNSSGNILNTNGGWRLNNDGSGQVANNNISWDNLGNVNFSPLVRLDWSGNNLIKLPWEEEPFGNAANMTYGSNTFVNYPDNSIASNNSVTNRLSNFLIDDPRDNIYTWVTKSSGIDDWNGGLRVNYNFDTSQSYMFAVWVKTTAATATSSSGGGAGIFFGLDSNNYQEVTHGVVEANPYFFSVPINSNTDRDWSLYVAIIRSKDTIINPANMINITGRYNQDGIKFGSTSPFGFKFNDSLGDNHSGYIRLGVSRVQDGNTFFQSPQLYVMDGSEPSINQLLGKNVNTTHINGNGIYTGSLTADQVNAVAINAASITTGTLSADRINTSEITSLGAVTAGSFNLGSGNFMVTPSGVMTALSGNIGGWNIGSNRIFSGSVELNSSGNISNTDNKWSLNNDGSGHIASRNVSWDVEGNVTMSPNVKIQYQNNNLISAPINVVDWGQITNLDPAARRYFINGDSNIQNLRTSNNIDSFVGMIDDTHRNNLPTFILRGDGEYHTQGQAGLRVQYSDFRLDQSYVMAVWFLAAEGFSSEPDDATITFSCNRYYTDGSQGASPLFSTVTQVFAEDDPNASRWRLLVINIKPFGTGTSNDEYSGIYNQSGMRERTVNGSLSWAEHNLPAQFNRGVVDLLIKIDNFGGQRPYVFVQSPQLYIMDGTQPSLNDMLQTNSNLSNIDSNGVYVGPINADNIISGTLSINRIRLSDINALGEVVGGSIGGFRISNSTLSSDSFSISSSNGNADWSSSDGNSGRVNANGMVFSGSVGHASDNVPTFGRFTSKVLSTLSSPAAFGGFSIAAGVFRGINSGSSSTQKSKTYAVAALEGGLFASTIHVHAKTIFINYTIRDDDTYIVSRAIGTINVFLPSGFHLNNGRVIKIRATNNSVNIRINRSSTDNILRPTSNTPTTAHVVNARHTSTLIYLDGIWYVE